MTAWPQMTLAGGPVQVTDRTLREQSRPVLYHYDPAFIELQPNPLWLCASVAKKEAPKDGARGARSRQRIRLRLRHAVSLWPISSSRLAEDENGHKMTPALLVLLEQSEEAGSCRLRS